ncbi:hypothetical protein KY317_02110 [Candidatus Woesearchaeota archaeon]|nr:hypothetical protein [Candidatus Woesearchaeota archaeon]
MEFLNYFLVVIICFIGIYAGFLLGMIAKEELKAGKKYFLLFQKILFAVVIISTMIAVNKIYLAIVLFFILAYFMVYSRDVFIYLIFGILLFLNSRYGNLFLMQSCLIFLYGLAAGSLLRHDKKKFMYVLSRYVWFVAVALLLFMIL